MMNRYSILALSAMLLAGLAVGCDQRQSTAAQEVPAAAAASADQPVPASTEASAKIDQAVDATKVAAAKTGEAARATAAEASGKARETAAEAYARAGEAADLAGQAASDIADDLKKGAAEAAEAAGKAGDRLSSAVDRAGDSAREAAAVAADKAGQAMDTASDRARDFAEGLRSSDEGGYPSAGASGLTLKFLAHQRFTLTRVNEADYRGEQRPFVEFGEQGLVSGKICNNFRGPGQLNNGVLTVEAMASTRMMCPSGGLNELETRFFNILSQGAELSMEGSSLIFKQGGNVMVFTADTRL